MKQGDTGDIMAAGTAEQQLRDRLDGAHALSATVKHQKEERAAVFKSIVEALLAAGADPTMQDQEHHTALFQACDSNDADIVELLAQREEPGQRAWQDPNGVNPNVLCRFDQMHIGGRETHFQYIYHIHI